MAFRFVLSILLLLFGFEAINKAGTLTDPDWWHLAKFTINTALATGLMHEVFKRLKSK